MTRTTCGVAALQSDGHTVRFSPVASFTGLASFDFTVAGSDGTTSATRVGVLVQP